LKWSVPWLTPLEIKRWGWKWWFERVHRTSMEVKDFGQTPFDYVPTDLDYKLLKRLQIFEMECPMAYTT